MNNNAQKLNLLARMPPRRAQGYPERVAKRRRVVGHNTAAPDQPGHPHPSLLQPVHSGSSESTQGGTSANTVRFLSGDAISPDQYNCNSSNSCLAGGWPGSSIRTSSYPSDTVCTRSHCWGWCNC